MTSWSVKAAGTILHYTWTANFVTNYKCIKWWPTLKKVLFCREGKCRSMVKKSRVLLSNIQMWIAKKKTIVFVYLNEPFLVLFTVFLLNFNIIFITTTEWTDTFMTLYEPSLLWKNKKYFEWIGQYSNIENCCITIWVEQPDYIVWYILSNICR